MKKIPDQKLLSRLLSRHSIESFFSVQDLPFELYSFEKGEYLNNELDPLEYLLFPVSGAVRILHIRDDGSVHQISAENKTLCLGDMEFATGRTSLYLIEAAHSGYCIALPLKECRKQLKQDPVFLNFLLGQLARKIELASASQALPRNLKERLDFYIRTQCQDNTLKGVERAASALSVSKRQLLRILKELCNEGIMEKEGKGTYRLLTADEIPMAEFSGGDEKE